MQAGSSTSSLPPPRVRVTRNGYSHTSNTLSDDFPSDFLRDSVQLVGTGAPFGEHASDDFSQWNVAGGQANGSANGDMHEDYSRGSSFSTPTTTPGPSNTLRNFSASTTPTPHAVSHPSTTPAARLRSIMTRLPPQQPAKLPPQSETESDDLFSRTLPRLSPKETTREAMSRVMNEGLSSNSVNLNDDIDTGSGSVESRGRRRSNSASEPGSPRISPRRGSASDDERGGPWVEQSGVGRQSRSKSAQFDLLRARLESADLDESLPPSVASESEPSPPPTPRIPLQPVQPVQGLAFPTNPRSRSPSPVPNLRRSRTASGGAGHATDSLSLLASRISIHSEHSADESYFDGHGASITKTKADVQQEKERGWNHPARRPEGNRRSLPNTPHHHHSHSRSVSQPSPPSHLKPPSPPSPSYSQRSASPLHPYRYTHSRQGSNDSSRSGTPILDQAQWKHERERNWNSPRPKVLPPAPPGGIRRRESMESIGSPPDARALLPRRQRLDSTSSIASTSSAISNASPPPAAPISPKKGKEKPTGTSLLSLSSSRLLHAIRPSSPSPAANQQSPSQLPSTTPSRPRTLSTPVSTEKEREKLWSRPSFGRPKSVHESPSEQQSKTLSKTKSIASSLLSRTQSFGSSSSSSKHSANTESKTSLSDRPVTPPMPAAQTTSGFPRESKGSPASTSSPSRSSSFRNSLRKVFKSSRSSAGSISGGEEPRAPSPSTTPVWIQGGGQGSPSHSATELESHPDPNANVFSDLESEKEASGPFIHVVDLGSSVPPSPLEPSSMKQPPSLLALFDQEPNGVEGSSKLNVEHDDPVTTSNQESASDAHQNRKDGDVYLNSEDEHDVSTLLSETDQDRAPSTSTTPQRPSYHSWQSLTPSPPPGGLPELPPDFDPNSTTEHEGETETELEEIPEEAEVEPDVTEEVDSPAVEDTFISAAPVIKERDRATNTLLSTPQAAQPSSVSSRPLKTPKPPGGWSTPAPPPADHAPALVVQTDASPLVRSGPTGSSKQSSALSSGPSHNTTPLAPSIFRENEAQPVGPLVLAPKTPAPPGAWAATPQSSLRKKGIMRVRFDRSPSPSGSDREMDGIPMAVKSEVITMAHDLLMPRFQQQPMQQTPYRPRLNAVDAFGRELYAEDGTPIKRSTESPIPPTQPTQDGASDSKRDTETLPGSSVKGPSRSETLELAADANTRRKGKAKMADETGPVVGHHENGLKPGAKPTTAERAIGEPSTSEDRSKTSHVDTADVLEFMRNGLEKLSNAVDDQSTLDPADFVPPTSLSEALEREERIRELKSQSHTSRVERGKITRQSQLARNGSAAASEKVDRLRAKRSRGPLTGTSVEKTLGHSSGSGFTWRFWTFLGLLQLVILYFAIEWSEHRAEYLFLTTHYDPAYPTIDYDGRLPWFYRPAEISGWEYPGSSQNFIVHTIVRVTRFSTDFFTHSAHWEEDLQPYWVPT